MLLLAVIWGLSIPATKIGLGTVPPVALIVLRFLIAVPLLLVFTLGRRRPMGARFPGWPCSACSVSA